MNKYPNVHYEKLDFYYACIKGLSVLDEDVINDLTSLYGWQGVVIASWFSILNPSKVFYESLSSSRLKVPFYNQWIVDLALAEIDEVIFVENKDLQLKVHKFIKLLNYSKYTKTKVRKFFPDNIINKENELVEELRLIFKMYGVSAANKYLKKSPLFGLFLPANSAESQ